MGFMISFGPADKDLYPAVVAKMNEIGGYDKYDLELAAKYGFYETYCGWEWKDFYHSMAWEADTALNTDNDAVKGFTISLDFFAEIVETCHELYENTETGKKIQQALNSDEGYWSCDFPNLEYVEPEEWEEDEEGNPYEGVVLTFQEYEDMKGFIRQGCPRFYEELWDFVEFDGKHLYYLSSLHPLVELLKENDETVIAINPTS